MTATQLFATSLANFVSIYSLLLLVRILLTWFQTMEWASNIAAFLSPITDPYLNIFRSFIPPLGGIGLVSHCGNFRPQLRWFSIN